MESSDVSAKLYDALHAAVEAMGEQMEEAEALRGMLDHLISLMRAHGDVPAAEVLEAWEVHHGL